jgi:hypothetical protein
LRDFTTSSRIQNWIPIKQISFCGRFQAAPTVSDIDVQMRMTLWHPVSSGDRILSNSQIHSWLERDRSPITLFSAVYIESIIISMLAIFLIGGARGYTAKDRERHLIHTRGASWSAG